MQVTTKVETGFETGTNTYYAYVFKGIDIGFAVSKISVENALEKLVVVLADKIFKARESLI